MADLTEKNRAHWDARAKTYNEKYDKTVQRMIEEIRLRRDWIGADFLDEDEGDEEDDEIADSDERANEGGGDGKMERKVVRLLDYACGPGMVSQALMPYISQAQGIDLSSSMVSVYNTNAGNQGLQPSEMSAAVGNLLSPNDPSPEDFRGEEWSNFDIAAVGLGFHHFEDPTLAATRLAERLKPGGVLLIIDFLPHDNTVLHSAEDTSIVWPDKEKNHSHPHGPFHGHGHGHGLGHNHTGSDHGDGSPQSAYNVEGTVAHFGFSEEQVKKSFETAGVGKDFAFQIMAKGVVFTFEERRVTRTIFMARGVKG